MLNLYFPQYQGSGPENSISTGAETLYKYFSQEFSFTKVECFQNISSVDNNIFSYDILLENFLSAKNIIKNESPEKIFLLGGDCSTELSVVSWLNHKYQNDLLVIWLDAHGDLNTPESSYSKNLNGMPLRTLLGEGDDIIVSNLFSILNVEQVVLAAARDLDEAEINFIEQSGLKHLGIPEFKTNFINLIQTLKTRFSNVYIHCDLDVIDPSDVPYVKSVTPNGIKLYDLIELIHILKQEFNIVGQSLTEYTGKEFIPELKELI